MSVSGSDVAGSKSTKSIGIAFPASSNTSKINQDVRFASRTLTPILGDTTPKLEPNLDLIPLSNPTAAKSDRVLSAEDTTRSIKSLSEISPRLSSVARPVSSPTKSDNGQHQKVLQDVNRALELKRRHNQQRQGMLPRRSINANPPFSAQDQHMVDSLAERSNHRRTVSMSAWGPSTSLDWSKHDLSHSPSARKVSLLGKPRQMGASHRHPNRPADLTDELQQMKSRFSPSTTQMAAAVAGELSRRYTILYSMLELGAPPLNPLAIVRSQSENAAAAPASSFPRDNISLFSNAIPLRLDKKWSLSAELIENYRLQARSQIRGNDSPMRSLASLSSDHSSLDGRADYLNPAAQAGSFHRIIYPLSSLDSVEGRGASFVNDTIDTHRSQRWRFSLSSRSSQNQSPRESLHNVLSLTRTNRSNLAIEGHSTKESLPGPRLSIDGHNILGFTSDHEHRKPSVGILRQDWPLTDSEALVTSGSTQSPISNTHQKDASMKDLGSRSLDPLRSPIRRWIVNGDNFLSRSSHSVLDRETIEHERVIYQARARTLLNCKQANDRASRTLGVLSDLLNHYTMMQEAGRPIVPGFPQLLLNILTSAGKDYTSQVLPSAPRSDGKNATWDLFTEQQCSIRKATNLLRFESNDWHTQVCLLSRAQTLQERLDRATPRYARPKKRLTNVRSQLQSVEATQADAHHVFHMVFLATNREYPEMHNVTDMADRYTPLKTKLVEALWNYGGPLIDFIGTNFAAPVLKSYGKRYIWPDLRDFVIIPYFKADYEGVDPKEFKLSFPKRSLVHWCIALTVDCTLFSVAKLLWDTANLVEWIAGYNFSRPQYKLTTWFSWVMFRGASILLVLGSLCIATAGFSIIAAVLWWLTWYLSMQQSRRSQPFLWGWSAVGSFLILSFTTYVWWVVTTPPLWGN